MTTIRRYAAVLLMSVALIAGVAGTAQAQDAPDYTAQCNELAGMQVQLDAQVAEFEASIEASRVQIDALDAVLGPDFDAMLDSYRAYLDASEATFMARVSSAQAMIDAGLTAYNC